MKEAIQYVQEMSLESAVSLKFNRFEIRYEDIGKSEEILESGGKIVGIVVNATDITTASMRECIDSAALRGAGYVVLDTRGMGTLSGLADILSELSDYIAERMIKIYVENGYVCRNGVHYHTESSNSSALCSLMEKLNAKVSAKDTADGADNAGSHIFGICINVGYANLLEINVAQFITECGKYLAVMHMNDNNGFSDQQQMPYTFTTGRGINSTDWYHIIGSLYKLNFGGDVVFDTVGTFKRTPVMLHGAMIELLRGIYSEWEACLNIESRLDKPGRKLILFGAGKMAENYMNAFGDKYPPEFLVDNNPKVWGTKRLGLMVKQPEAILEVPENERSVWICNMYYDAVGIQLTQMGIEYECYFDHYYL